MRLEKVSQAQAVRHKVLENSTFIAHASVLSGGESHLFSVKVFDKTGQIFLENLKTGVVTVLDMASVAVDVALFQQSGADAMEVVPSDTDALDFRENGGAA